MLTERQATNFAFIVGLTTAPVWCGAQIYNAYTSMSGVSLAQYIAFCASFLIGFSLAFEAKKTNPGLVIKQQVILQAFWGVGSTLLVGVVLSNGNYQWTESDTRLSLIVLSGTVAVTIWKTTSKRRMSDPAVRGLVSITLKALPQLALVPIIWTDGGAGYHWVAILFGNFSIMSRLFPLYASLRNEGMNDAKWWLIAQDTLNSASWVLVSLIWLVR